MQEARSNLSDLQHAIRTVEARQEVLETAAPARLSFGHAAIDRHLKGGLLANAMHEVRCSLTKDIACASALIYGLLANPKLCTRQVLWICDPAIGHDGGSAYPDGLRQFGIDPVRFVFVQPSTLKDAIWAAGEASTQGNLAAVVIQLKGNPKLFDLSVSRKLMLRAQQNHTPVFILRQAGREEASSAATRWHVSPLPSLPDHTFHHGVGAMRLTLTLERNRNGQTGQWTIAWNSETRSFEHAAKLSKPKDTGLPSSPSSNRRNRSEEMGQVMAFDRAS